MAPPRIRNTPKRPEKKESFYFFTHTPQYAAADDKVESSLVDSSSEEAQGSEEVHATLINK